MTGAKFAAAGAAAAAAAAVINGTQERVILGNNSDKKFQELTGAKFGMMIWTRIGGSCLGDRLGLLQTKTMSTKR